jgi:hypothetical protein
LPTVFAIEEGTGAARIAVDKQVDEYILPYPGMLPTNPLYIVKALRDKFIIFLITDSIKKAEFYLLQSDKHLSSAMYLFPQKKDTQIALQELSQSSVSLRMAVESIKKGKEEKLEAEDIEQKMIISLHKHLLVLQSMEKGKDKNVKELINKEVKEVEDLIKEASKNFLL